MTGAFSPEVTQLMMLVMIDLMRQQMEVSTLRQCLGRDPTLLELEQYRNELYWRGVDQWWQDRLTAPQKIHDFVWGGN